MKKESKGRGRHSEASALASLQGQVAATMMPAKGKTASASAGDLAHACGLSGLQQVVDETGLAARTLHLWAKTRPELLECVLMGVAVRVLPSCAEITKGGCCLRAEFGKPSLHQSG